MVQDPSLNSIGQPYLVSCVVYHSVGILLLFNLWRDWLCAELLCYSAKKKLANCATIATLGSEDDPQ